MRRTLKAVGLLLPALAFHHDAVAQAQRDVGSREGQDVTTLRAPLNRFDGTVLLKTKDGTTRPLRVVIRNWIIDNRRQLAAFPEKGFMIVQLRGGDLTTVIGGTRQRRTEGEFWTVPAGSTMGIETGNDSAILQTVAVIE